MLACTLSGSDSSSAPTSAPSSSQILLVCEPSGRSNRSTYAPFSWPKWRPMNWVGASRAFENQNIPEVIGHRRRGYNGKLDKSDVTVSQAVRSGPVSLAIQKAGS